MGDTAADFLVERLMEWGVDTVYGYPGDGINGILGALDSRSQSIRFVQARHEEMAAFMACAHAKFTGGVGVCIATSGPGAVHLLNGLYDAKLDSAPVVAIVGQAPTHSLGGDMQQEVDLLTLFKDVASAYVQQASTSSQVRHLVDRAFRIALGERTVTALIIPTDVQDEKAVAEQPEMPKSIHSAAGWSAPIVVPRRADLERAADVLNSGKKVAILVGQGAREATDEVLEVASLLGAGVAKALLGKAVIPDDVPFCTNSIGLLGTRPTWNMMKGCDTLLMIGTGFPYAEYLPSPGQARAVQIDIQPGRLGIRYDAEVMLAGDARATLSELIPLLQRNPDRSWQEEIVKDMEAWRRRLQDQVQDEAAATGLMKPQVPFAALSRHLPDNAILTADSGSTVHWYARYVQIRRGMMASLSGNLATMLPAVPYAIAAKFAHPERVAVAMVGDGAMQMLAMNELITIARYYRTWSDPRLVVLVLNNRDLNLVTWEQRVLAGDRKFDESQDLPEFDYAAFARTVGLEGVRVTNAEEADRAWQQAFEADRPWVIDAVVDPTEPPLPPHVTIDQARKAAMALMKGDSQAIPVAIQSLREKIDEFLPGRE